MDYSVGQVLYCLNEKNFKIIPVQVVEEVVRTTITGKSKTYMIMFPDEKKTIVDIENISSKMFTTRNSIRDYMLDNTRATIEKMLSAADKTKKDVFEFLENESEEFANGPTDLQNVDNLEENAKFVQPNEEENIIKIDLGNGLKAKLNTSELEKVKK